MIRWTASGLGRAGLIRPLSFAAGYARRAPGFLVLKYHRVNDDADAFFPAQATEVFQRHMAFIARTYLVLPIEELVERMNRGALPRNGLAITFDDGYRDNLTHAAPVLARYGLPATIFIASGFVGGKVVPWFDRVAQAFKATRVAAYRTPWGEEVGLGTTEDRIAGLGRVLEHMKRLSDDDLRSLVERVWVELGVTGEGAFKNLMLSWDDVHALGGLGFRIGAHTVTHPILSRVSRGRVEAEVRDSRAMIAAACGRPPLAFAYPNGGSADYTEMVGRVVREAGFTCAATTRFGVNTTETPRYELRRGGPWEDDLSTFALKLAVYRLA
jgi:peptidoglycan/xylan/chitin deacetylase (PgdA/CDA1 family)